jgi:RNA-directed DNA polymerase
MQSFLEWTDLWSLRAAARRAARGLSRRQGAAAFLCELDAECLQLQRELRGGTYAPGPFHHFRIRDPKPRRISVAPFRDRVVHHALCAALEPVLESVADPDSYACRKKKGTHAALARVRGLVRAHSWFAKVDVHHCFETMDVERLLARLAPLIDDPATVDAAARIVRGGAIHGRGLPIGNLTSQHFANLALGALDAHARSLRVGGYVRYMDDVLVFGASLDEVRAYADALGEAMGSLLAQAEKRAARRVGQVHAGVPFLGYRVWPGLVRLDGARRRRFLARVRGFARAVAAGHMPEADAARRAGAAVAWVAHADTLRLRQSLDGPARGASCLARPRREAPTG